MEKQLINLTSGFLRMNRLVLFLLISFPITIRFYSPPSDDFAIINRLIESIGGACLLCWLFAIAHKASGKLTLQGIALNSFRFFNWAVVLAVVSYFLILFFSTNVNIPANGFNINYVKPLFLPIIFILSFLVIIFIAAKALVSAELNKDAGAGEYFTTFLLMLVASIGLWFIQPRVKKI